MYEFLEISKVVYAPHNVWRISIKRQYKYNIKKNFTQLNLIQFTAHLGGNRTSIRLDQLDKNLPSNFV